MSRAKAEAARRKRRAAAIQLGWRAAAANTVLAGVASCVGTSEFASLEGVAAWAVLDSDGRIVVNRERDAEPDEWAWVYAHLLLHLGLGHTDKARVEAAGGLLANGEFDPVYVAACCVVVARMAAAVPVGRAPMLLPALPGGDELSMTRRWRETGVPPDLRELGTGGARPCLVPAPANTGEPHRVQSWADLFAKGVAAAVREAVAGTAPEVTVSAAWDRALSWFVSTYPLLAAVATGFTLVADAELVRAWDITYAAVSPEHGEIYVNPHAALTAAEWRFVLAHEMLHAALGHHTRALGREPYLWNVACDYVINGWLVEMAVGHIPEGTLYDQRLAGLSAESVYDTLTTDLRRARKLRTLGGRVAGDVLGDWLSEPAAARRRESRRSSTAARPWDRPAQVDLDEFYRRALTQGLEYHQSDGRGFLPLGLEEEIRALDHPPLPWDARLARWFDEHVRAEEPKRTYARASRRQAATPDIPRPGRVRPEQLTQRSTFGVVLDTSGSMDTKLLGKALGAIASYALARDVPAARVMFCDAAAYDAGYLDVTEIAGKVRVRGRGGTMLQPGVNLLERAPDFPKDAPILVITDGECDVIRVRREHAFLVPAAARLPFTPRGPVFRVTGDLPN